MKDLYDDIERAASALMAAVSSNFPLHAEVKHDILNSLICFTEKKTQGGKKAKILGSDSESYYGDEELDLIRVFIHPVDRKNKPLYTKYTTEDVNIALANYLEVTERSLEVTGQGKKNSDHCIEDSIIVELYCMS